MKEIIKPREKEEDLIGGINRKNKIMEKLNSCFEEKSIDEKDEENILNWACGGIDDKRLFYLLDKIKFKRLKNIFN